MFYHNHYVFHAIIAMTAKVNDFHAYCTSKAIPV